MRYSKIWPLLLGAGLALSACRSTNSTPRNIALSKGAQIWRTTNKISQLRYILGAMPPTPLDAQHAELFKNFPPNGIWYCDGRCEKGKQGLSTGPFLFSGRHSAHVDRGIQFKFEGDATYVFKNVGGYQKDMTPGSNQSFEYRMEMEDDKNAKLLTAETTASGEHRVTGDPGYRMKDMGDYSWLRYNKNQPNDVKQQYLLKLAYFADLSETPWTDELFKDQTISEISEFKILVPADSVLGSGPLPDGPERGNPVAAASPDAADSPDRKDSTTDKDNRNPVDAKRSGPR